MGRLTWLADELRKAGLRVVEVDGWKTRGSTDFEPEGVTWHATAGSRTSSALGEVGVILHGSETAPPPIAQLMIYRDGVIYVCAAGRCNHNKVGWAGPNKGLGNTRLLGIEMANDNRGEPWPAAQLDAVRRATAVIMARLNADPMRRLAAHYEHQPYPAPAGETSTKTDPLGVVMAKERPRVAAIMEGDDVSVEEVLDALETARGQAAIAAAVGNAKIPAPAGSNDADGVWLLKTYVQNMYNGIINTRTYAAEGRTAAQQAVSLVQGASVAETGRDAAGLQQILQAIAADNVAVDIAALAAAIVELLPDTALTEGGVEQALRNVLRTGVDEPQG